MTFFFLVLLLVTVIIYIFWILLKPEGKHTPKQVVQKKSDHKNKPEKTYETTEKKQEGQISNIEPIRKKIAEQMKKDPEIISRALSYWLNQK